MYTILPYRETNFEEVKNQTRKGSLYLDNLYDGMLLYSQVLNQTLNKTDLHSGRSIYSGEMFYEMMGRTFKGR